MNTDRNKRLASILFITIGAVAMISEIAATNKNYYIQSIGLIFLMLGLFMVNTKVKSKAEVTSEDNFEEEE